MMMNLKPRRKKRRNIMKIIIIIVVLLIVSVGLFINYYSKKSLPILMSYAEAETKKLTILIINKAITKEISNIETDELFNIIYGDDGDIKMIDFNSQNTTKILTMMTTLVELNLRAVEEGKIDMLELPENSLASHDMNLLRQGIILEIPLGITTNSNLLYNLGPKVPVRLSLVGNVSTNFKTDIEEYGINSALLKLTIDIEVTTKTILPVVSDENTISCNIPIAIKIIQGKIPDYYMNGFATKSNIVEEK